MAKEVRYWLNEGDKALLDEIVQWYLRRVPESQERGRRRLGDDGSGGSASDEVLLVRSPEGGIPALSTAGTTGTGSADATDDTPGSATCDVYRTVSGRPRVTGVRVLVYNYSQLAIPAGMWVKAAKDRWGTWLADTFWLETTEC